jgi:hypothetical protein
MMIAKDAGQRRTDWLIDSQRKAAIWEVVDNNISTSADCGLDVSMMDGALPAGRRGRRGAVQVYERTTPRRHSDDVPIHEYRLGYDGGGKVIRALLFWLIFLLLAYSSAAGFSFRANGMNGTNDSVHDR